MRRTETFTHYLHVCLRNELLIKTFIIIIIIIIIIIHYRNSIIALFNYLGFVSYAIGESSLISTPVNQRVT